MKLRTKARFLGIAWAAMAFTVVGGGCLLLGLGHIGCIVIGTIAGLLGYFFFFCTGKYGDARPFMAAVEAGDIPAVSRILDDPPFGVSPNMRYYRDVVGAATPLHFAAQFGQVEMITFLLARGADINSLADADQVDFLLVRYDGPTPEELHSGPIPREYNGCLTALQVAAWYGHRQAAEVLMSQGLQMDCHCAAALNAPDKLNLGGMNLSQLDKTILLCWAVRGHALDAAKLLLKEGAATKLDDVEDISPLSYAIQADDMDMVDLLLAAGAAPGEDDGLPEAVGQGNIRIAQRLLAAGADPNRRCYPSPLFVAIRQGNVELVKLLLSAGADPNYGGSSKQLRGMPSRPKGDLDSWEWELVPLLVAVVKGQGDIVRLLVEAGADPMIKGIPGPHFWGDKSTSHEENTQAITPLEAANRYGGSPHMIEYLRKVAGR